jgi:hypothetical protein
MTVASPPDVTIDAEILDLLHRARHWFEQFNRDDEDCEFVNSDECSELALALEDDLSLILTKIGALP